MKIEFAPIQGYTDAPYRNLHNEIFGGVTTYYSPFIRLEAGNIRNKDLKDISSDLNENHPVVPQIIVNGVDEFCRLSEVLIEKGYCRIDINMGCSFPLQTKKGRGAALLAKPETVKEICYKINEYTPIEYSIKMRLGVVSADDSINLLPIINDTRLSHVTVHPRLASQQYKGEIDHESFKNFYKNCRHNIVYNGDLHSVADIKRIVDSYPDISGVMIGRGLLERPSLAYEYINNTQLSNSELISLIMQMHSRLADYYSSVLQGETQLLMKLKTFWEYLEPEIGRKTAKLIKKAVNLSKYNSALSTIEY